MDHFFLETSYGKIHGIKHGIGEKKLLLLHGAGCDNAKLSWQDAAERLYYDVFTVYAIDLPGYGQSERIEDMAGEEFYQKHVRVLEECCQQLELQHFILAGLSMGGAISVRFAIDNPDVVSELFLIDSWGLTEKLKCHGLAYWYLKKEKRLKKWYQRLAKSRWLTKKLIGYSLYGNADKITESLVDEVWEACRTPDAEKSMYQYVISSMTKKNCIPYYTRDDWERLPMRVYFLHGDKDPLVPVADAIHAAEAVPMGKFVKLSGCKHWAVRENPFIFLDMLTELCREDEMVHLSEDEDWSDEVS